VANSTRDRRPRKPEKPYPDFPLTAHPSGRWCKKIRPLGSGKTKTFYFGSWKDGAKAALDRYLREKDDLYAGRTPGRPAAPDAYTVGRMCNEFLNAKSAALTQGRITAGHFKDLLATCERLVAFFTPGRDVEAIGPNDFERLAFDFPATWKLHRRKREVGAIRSVFTYAATKEAISRTRFGTFKAPARDELDAERFRREREHGTREFTPAQLHTIIDAAPVTLKAMILLAVNAGFGNTDVATLPRAYLDLEGGWANYPRPKTTIRRRAKLWPETVAAVRAALDERPHHLDPADAELVFITVNGLRWVRAAVEKDAAGAVAIKTDDSVSKGFRTLLASLEMRRPGLSFYSLRHCCETHGGADQIAVDAVMGHRTPGMGTNYRQGIDDARLVAVADNLHAWLYAEGGGA
jgi:integrase